MLFPAHAGVIPRHAIVKGEKRTFPRTRGGDPKDMETTVYEADFSPHTRG